MDNRSRRASGRNLTLSGSTEPRLLGAGERLVKLCVHLFQGQVWTWIVQRTSDSRSNIRKRLNMFLALSLPQTKGVSDGLARRAIFARPNAGAKLALHFGSDSHCEFLSKIASHHVTFATSR
jgi:hypothetical protein